MSSFFRRQPTAEQLEQAHQLTLRGSELYMDYVRSPAAHKIQQLFDAIRCFTAALEVFTETGSPREWALVQNNLGGAYRNLPTGSKRGNVTRAIEHYKAASRGYLALQLRDRWASTQYNLGNAYRDLPTDDIDERDRLAIECYLAALEVRTEEQYPVEWARTVQNLASVYAGLSDGERTDNLHKAIGLYQSALRVLTDSRAPIDWAMTHLNLAEAYSDLSSSGHTDGNPLQKARAEYELASTVFSEREFPVNWATVQTGLANVLMKTRTGSKSDNLRAAIAHLDSALGVFTKRDFPNDWAKVQCTLGEIYGDVPFGKPSENAKAALNHYLSALEVYTPEDAPLGWARAELDLADLYARIPTGDWQRDLNQAIASCERVLGVFSETRSPRFWAMAQFTLGDAYRSMRHGRQQHLRQARNCYEAALRVTRRELLPELWANLQLKLGRLHAHSFAGDRHENIRAAIACYQRALQVLTKQTYPQTWARTQDALGQAYFDWPGHDGNVALESSLRHYNAALEVFSRKDYPEDWARTLNNRGGVYSKLRTGNPHDNVKRALDGYADAGEVFTEHDHPFDWAILQSNIGKAYCELTTGDRQDNLKRAIAAFQGALRVLTESEFPLPWATCQHNLGTAYKDLPSREPTNLERAVECYAASLHVHTEQDHPEEWARTQNALGNVYRELATDDAGLERARNSFEAALRVSTEDRFPFDWALVQNNLGALYVLVEIGDRGAHLRAGIQCFRAALRVYTEEASPSMWAVTQSNLGGAYIQLREIDPDVDVLPAIEALRASLRVLDPYQRSFDRLNVLQNLSTALYRERRWDETLAVSIESIELLETMRSLAVTQQERHRVLSQHSSMFERAAVACVALNRFEEAFVYTERGKTRNLVDGLVRRDAKPVGVEPMAWHEYVGVLAHLESLERELQATELLRTGGSRYTTLRAQLDDARNQLSRMEAVFRDVAPDYLPTSRPIGFEAARTIARQSQSVLVEFRITEAGTFVFLLDGDDAGVSGDQVVEVPGFTNAALIKMLVHDDDRAVDGWLVTYDGWRRGLVSQERWMECLERTLVDLHRLLLQPVLERIRVRYPAATRLMLVPNQRLHLFPLHAARSGAAGDARYLLDGYEIAYAPSCSVLQRCLDWDAVRRQRGTLFAVQNPQGDLPFADWDVEEASQYFARTEILNGRDATAARTKSQIGNGHEILLSCHGHYNVNDAAESELVLQGADRLKQNEILELDLSGAWLVVLSACETNLTDFRDVMDEVQGMHTAFLVARAPTVVGTLWAVSDLSTALLMKRFHEKLYADGMRKAEAIRAAQIWLRDLPLADVQVLLDRKRRELEKIKDIKRVETIEATREYLADLAATHGGKPFAHPHWWAAFQCVGAP